MVIGGVQVPIIGRRAVGHIRHFRQSLEPIGQTMKSGCGFHRVISEVCAHQVNAMGIKSRFRSLRARKTANEQAGSCSGAAWRRQPGLR